MTPASTSRCISDRRGAVAIEYGLVLPVLLLFLLGLIDTSRLLWTYTTLYRAVEAAARCAAVNAPRCTTTEQIRAYAAAEAWGLPVTASAFTVSIQPCGVYVQARYDFTFVVPWLTISGSSGSSNMISLTASACYPL